MLAYQQPPDDQGIRLVMMQDGSIKRMNDVEFQAAPKAKRIVRRAASSPPKAK